MFKRIFGQGSNGGGPGGGGGGNSTTRTVDAIQKLGETEELLIKRRALLEKKIEAEQGKAREKAALKDKRAALMALKKKKMYETQLEQVENNILRVNEQQMMLENQRTTVETVSALRNAAQASKATMSEMKINDVDTVLDEISEQTDQMQQIQDAMAQPIGAAADLDEDELLGELEELESQQLDAQLLAPAAPSGKVAAAVPAAAAPATAARAQAEPALPSVPTTKPAAAAAAKAKTAEELELEALEAEMAQ